MGSELADSTLLGAQSNLKALVLVGCEQRMKLGCRSWMGFYGSHGKISLSRGWAAHMDDQLHLPADRVSQSQDCSPAWSLSPWMGNVLHPLDWLCSASHSTAHVKPGSFMGLEDKPRGWAGAEVGGSTPMKTLSANKECGRPHCTVNFTMPRNENAIVSHPWCFVQVRVDEGMYNPGP